MNIKVRQFCMKEKVHVYLVMTRFSFFLSNLFYRTLVVTFNHSTVSREMFKDKIKFETYQDFYNFITSKVSSGKFAILNVKMAKSLNLSYFER